MTVYKCDDCHMEVEYNKREDNWCCCNCTSFWLEEPKHLEIIKEN